ncbi:putative reverse transcriptase domain-containing protein [Tanacetum coccineum]
MAAHTVDSKTISTIQPSIHKAKEGVSWTTRILACSKSIDRGTNIQRGGKIQKQKRKTTEEEGSSNQVNEAYWKKFSIWYRKLRYWRLNFVPHCIDFLYVEKNICESLVGTLLNVPGKTKDGVNARLDLAELGIKPKLFARQEEDKTILPLAVYQNSGVSVEAVDLHISKEVATTRKAFYYGVLQEIWVLDYRFRQIPLFKCDWVNHKAGGVKHDPNLGYTLVDLNSLGHKDDPFILASQARQVFYVKDQIDKKLSIVFRTPTKNYKDTYDEVDEEFSTVIHEHNDNILPRVNRRDLGNESQNDYYRTDCEEPI